MQLPRVSIIVPVFNAANYLERCLDSLLAQEIDSFEIICVDDGSTDDSLKILSRYSQDSPELIRVVSQENGGASVARNNGISLARSPYVAFVDADDWVSTTFIAALLTLAESNNLDVAHGNGICHFEGERDDFEIYQIALPAEIMTGRDVLRIRLQARTFWHFPVLLLYRTEFLKKHQLQFIPGRLHEDVLWVTAAFLRAERVAYCHEPGYIYRRYQRPANIYVSPAISNARLRREIDSAVANAFGLEGLIADIDSDSELKRVLSWQLVDGALSVFHHVKKIGNSSLRRQCLCELRGSGFYSLLWKHASEFGQYRKIIRNWLRSF